jgi:hypothetical protein
MILINDSNLSFANGAYLKGQSRLQAGIRSIKALSDLYDTVNTLISNKGAAGFLTNKSKAGAIDTGWDDDDKRNVESKLYAYGTTSGKKPIGVTTKDLGFVRLSVPISEFMPIELKLHEFRTLASAIMFPSVLLNDKEGSIYNNVALAQKAFYTDCLQPVVNSVYQGVTNGFGLNEMNEAIIADWSDVECLKADKKIEADTDKAINDLYKDLFDNDLVTRNQWLTALGLQTESNPDYNKKKSEIVKVTEPLTTEQNGQ